MIEELKVIISAEIDNLKKAVQSAKQQIDDLAKQANVSSEDVDNAISQMGQSIRTGLGSALNFAKTAFVGLTAAMVGVVKGTEEYRNNQAKLNSAFEAAGGSADTAKQAYNDLYRVLGDDGQAVEAAQHLAQLTTNEKELSQWTNIAKGVYATFGDSLPIESLTEAVNHSAKLGEVQGSLADALEWSGVSVDDFNEQLFWCNSESERQKLIAGTLNGIYSDAATIYEENNAQVLAQRDAQLQLNDALATVGEALAPVVTMLTELGAKVLTAIAPHIQSFAENHLPKIKSLLEGLIEGMAAAFNWMVQHKELLAVLATVIGVVAAAILAYNVVAAIKAAMAAAEVATVWGLVSGYIALAAATLVALAPYIAIVAAVAAVIAIFVALWNNCDGFRNFWIGLWEKLKEAFSKFVDTLRPLWEAIVGMFQEAWELIKVVWDLVAPFFQAIWERIKTAFSIAFEVIALPFKIAWEQIKFAWDVAVSYFTTLINHIKLTFSFVKNILSGNFKEAWEDIKKIFSNWGSFFGGLWDKVKSLFSNIAQTIGNSISNVVKTAINGVLSTAVNIINGFIKAINLAIGIINAIPGVNIKKINELQVPKLERGGVLKKGQVGLLEGNGAEAVVPLEKNTEWLDRISERLLKGLGGANRPVVLQVDGKTFAKTVINTVNADTRQKGKLGLNVV